jgi:hypothetical protein
VTGGKPIAKSMEEMERFEWRQFNIKRGIKTWKYFFAYPAFQIKTSVHSATRQAIHLQFDISVNALEIRAVLNQKYYHCCCDV